MKLSFPAFLVATGLLAESTNAQQRLRFLQPNLEESSMSSNDDRLKELEAAFPCLGSLASQTVVNLYVEQDDTAIAREGLVSDVIGTRCELPVRKSKLETGYFEGFSKPEMKQVCVTKCEVVEEDCSIIEFAEITNSQGEIRYRCYFYTDASIGAQFTVENPVISFSDTVAMSVFYKGQDLSLPKFQGCDVPVGDKLTLAILCALGLPLPPGAPVDFCNDFKPTNDFQNYIIPSVLCAAAEDRTQVQACLECLAEVDGSCDTRPICDEENFITKKCPVDLEKCTSSGKDNKCGTCGDVCPQACEAKLQTALLCSAGATPVFNSVQRDGGCLNANIEGLPDLFDGDYKCP